MRLPQVVRITAQLVLLFKKYTSFICEGMGRELESDLGSLSTQLKPFSVKMDDELV